MRGTIVFRLDEELKQKFQNLADKKSINTSDLLRKFIEAWIEENKEG